MQRCPLCQALDGHVVVSLVGSLLVRCRSCGLVYQTPLPVQRADAYYDAMYSHPDGARTEHARLGLFETFLGRVRFGGAGRLLDVGCGVGEFVAAATAAGWRSEGVEKSSTGREAARRRGRVVHASVADLARGHYDVVTLWNVVEFFHDPLSQLREVERVMAPGGLLFIRTPNAPFMTAFHRVACRLRWSRRLSRVLRRAYCLNPLLWTSASLKRALAEAGFRQVRIGNAAPSPGDPYRALPGATPLVHGFKLAVSATADVIGRLSVGRLLLAPSLEAWGRKAAPPC